MRTKQGKTVRHLPNRLVRMNDGTKNEQRDRRMWRVIIIKFLNIFVVLINASLLPCWEKIV